jgi:hypothetical protein
MQFAMTGYFVIKWLDRFNVHNGIGLGGEKPMLWFISDRGDSKNGNCYPELMDKFEHETNKMLDNWEIYGPKKLL